MKENILIIGLGSMGQRRIRILKALYPECSILGVDRNKTRAEKVKQEYSIEIYDELADINLPVYAAFVCTSPETHHSIIQKCLQKGCHVFSEINLIDMDYEGNMKLAEVQKKTLFLSSTLLYKEEISYIQKKVTNNHDKKIYTYHVGQYLPDWHPWDNLKDFFASKKKTNGCRELMAIEFPWLITVFGTVENVSVIKGNFSHLDIEFPDTYIIHLMHTNGTLGDIIIDVVSRKTVRKLEIYNETMYIAWNGTPDSLIEQDIEHGKTKTIVFDNYIHDNRYDAFVNEAPYIKEVEEFFEAVNGKPALYGFKEDKETIRLINIIEGQL